MLKEKGLKILMCYFIRKIISFAINIPLSVSVSTLYPHPSRGIVHITRQALRYSYLHQRGEKDASAAKKEAGWR